MESIASMSASELAEADRILDEAVNELFQDEGGDNLAEFVNDWNPSGQTAFGMALEDDAKLGFMLEKLLEDFERGQALLSYCQKTLRSARERLELVEADLSKEAPDEDSESSPKPDFSDQDDDVRLF